MWGTGTDPQFYEGMVMGLKEVGLKDFTFVEANNYHQWNVRGFVDINERHGIKMNECQRRVRNFDEGYQMNWTKVPEPVVYTHVPHYTPVNDKDTWLLNIAKWKAQVGFPSAPDPRDEDSICEASEQLILVGW